MEIIQTPKKRGAREMKNRIAMFLSMLLIAVVIGESHA